MDEARPTPRQRAEALTAAVELMKIKPRPYKEMKAGIPEVTLGIAAAFADFIASGRVSSTDD